MDKQTEQDFMKDVARHQMTIFREDGLYRHIRFRRDDSQCYLFDLITWPGLLCYTGDMGTFVFSRLPDMFEFFRTDRKYWNFNRNGGLSINPGYWAEKLQATEKNEGYEKFSEDKFNRIVIEYLVSWIREHSNNTTRDERRELWDDVVSTVIEIAGDDGGHLKMDAVYKFSHTVNRKVGSFEFMDFFENNFTEYTCRYIWCCYALAWGIKQYDDFKDAQNAI